MRVTGGALRGRKLRAPSGSKVRPSSDRVREALFARLGSLEEVEVGITGPLNPYASAQVFIAFHGLETVEIETDEPSAYIRAPIVDNPRQGPAVRCLGVDMGYRNAESGALPGKLLDLHA